MPQIVVTAVGPDRPGLVGEFSGHVFKAGANLADSRMVNLRGQFALIALVEGAEAALATLQRDLPAAAGAMGMRVAFAAEPGAAPAGETVPYRLKTYSMDQPGIVHRVSSVLRQHQINIEDLETHLESGPFMGTPLFTLELRMNVPRTLPVRQLRRELDAVCDELNCDYDLEPA